MSLVTTLATTLHRRGATLATAESCTGGLLGHQLTNQAGSSAWYVGGLIAYSDAVKQALLGVRRDTLERVGAVSAEVAEQMALGARQAFDTTCALSVTGIAGPGGGSADKPVGLTYIGVALPTRIVVRRFLWQGTREANKASSAEAALALLVEQLADEQKEEEPMSASNTVEATFEADGRIRPLAFVWNGQRRQVADWGRQWEADGTHHFLVMTPEQRVWELCFTPATLHWAVRPRSEARYLA